jgi:hypothetical protein
LSGLFSKKTYFACFAGVFLVDVILSFWTGSPYDMKIWFNTGSWLKQGINIYVPNDHLGYPPLWALWCYVAYQTYTFFGNNLEIWRFIIKLPMIIAQPILAYVIGKFAASRFDIKKARELFLITLVWSFIFYIGALWGQINVLSALLTFLAFYAVINRKTTIGALLLGIAITMKIYPLITLPAFFVYILRKKSRSEASKFSLYTIAVPILFTVIVFAALRWSIVPFLQTIFYWAPNTNPTQLQGGCMNIWSFSYLFNIDISKIGPLRLVWIPFLAATSIYWLKKRDFDDSDLNLSIISLYLLFMITYVWITEQTFIDPLPFILLQTIAYRPKRSQLYLLSAIQIVIFAFSMVNGGALIFEPLASNFSPAFVSTIQNLSPNTFSLAWTIRGYLGLIISLSLGGFLLFLMKPSILDPAIEQIHLKLRPPFKQKKHSAQ